MTQVFEGKEFKGLHDRNSGRVFAELDLRRCSFEDCSLSVTSTPELRSTVRNVKLSDCAERGCTIQCPILDDVLVDGLDSDDPVRIWGAAFRHVTLQGRLGRILISQLADPLEPRSKMQQAFDEANRAFYANVDWALDISRAEAEELDIRGIPAHRVRLDPQTQAVVTRDQALAANWRKLDLGETWWPEAIEGMLERGDEDLVLVAPKRNPKFATLLDGLILLRKANVAA